MVVKSSKFIAVWIYITSIWYRFPVLDVPTGYGTAVLLLNTFGHRNTHWPGRPGSVAATVSRSLITNVSARLRPR
jgi:hypothetical protein